MSAVRLLAPSRTFASIAKHRNYRLFLAGQVVSNTGTWMQRIAQAWLVVRLTHSPVEVGILSVCQYAPFTLLGLFAGVAADRFDPRRIVLATQTVSMVLAGVMAALAWSGHAQVWHVDVIAALMGAVLVVDAPARQTLTFQMVGRDELPNAVALNSSVFNAARIFGPAVAGATIAAGGVGVCFLLNAASFLAVLAGLLAMRKRDLFPLGEREHPTLVRGAMEGLAYARREPRVRLALLTVLALSVLCFNFPTLLPLLASETLRGGPNTFGVISALFGAGALFGALITATVARASWRALLAGIVVFGAAQLVLAPARDVATVSALLFVSGIAFTVCSSNIVAALQLAAPDHLRGRVLGLYLYAFAGATPFGGILIGWLCQVGGTRLACWLAGGASLAIAGLVAVALRLAPAPAPAPAAPVPTAGPAPSLCD